jgi:hypothetical protein
MEGWVTFKGGMERRVTFKGGMEGRVTFRRRRGDLKLVEILFLESRGSIICRKTS